MKANGHECYSTCILGHTHTRMSLTVCRQDGPVLCSEAAACNAAVGAKGDPHRAAVSVDCWGGYVTAEPEGIKDVIVCE